MGLLFTYLFFFAECLSSWSSLASLLSVSLTLLGMEDGVIVFGWIADGEIDFGWIIVEEVFGWIGVKEGVGWIGEKEETVALAELFSSM